jgi:hypothetical protein
MFVAATDFDYQPYNIPNHQEVLNSFEAFVNDYEELILKRMLGVQLYNEFVTALEEDYPDEKWLNLKDGATYQIDGKTYEWVGLMTRKGALVPYLYAMWTSFGYQEYTGQKVYVFPKIENSEPIGPVGSTSAYAQFLLMVGYKCKSINTLYGFLKANESDYPSLQWTDPGSYNAFDL